jgi:hypothetical protein
MPYQAAISRDNPSCFLFLIDQSGSMADPVGGQNPPRSKAEQLADAINRLLADLCIRCTKNPREGVRHYYDVGVLGYGPGETVKPAFAGPLSGRQLVPIGELAANPLDIETRKVTVEDGAGGLTERSVRFPIWFRPVADNGTPMCGALSLAYTILENWVRDHPNAFPPIVINITDGQPTDGDPVPQAQRIQQLATSDGNVLLFNLHISETQAQPLLYPDQEASLPDDYARMLFRMSSVLPPHMVKAAQAEGLPISPNSRGFVFNANMVEVIRFLNIGTRPRDLR